MPQEIARLRTEIENLQRNNIAATADSTDLLMKGAAANNDEVSALKKQMDEISKQLVV